MAVEDAFVLAGLLTSDITRSASDIKYALRAYDKVRRPRSQELVKRSRSQGKRWDLQADDDSLSNAAFDEMKAAVEKNMEWVWEFDPAEMLEEAKRLVESYKATNSG